MEVKSTNNGLQELLAREQGTLYAVIFTLLGGSTDAMDVLQETNLAILEELRTGIPSGENDCVRWFKKVAMSTVHEFRRRKRRERLLFDDELAAKLADIVAQPGENGELDGRRHLRTCVRKLPSWQQGILKERYRDATPVQEMAKRRAVSRVSLSVLMFRMRNALKSCMERLRKRDELGVLPETPEEEFVAGLEEIFDGIAGETTVASVANALRSSDAMLALYAEHAALHAMLAFEGRNAGSGERRGRFRFSAVAALAMLCASAAFAYFAFFQEAPAPEQYGEERIWQDDTTGEEEMKAPKSMLVAAAVVATAAIADERAGASTASSGVLAFNDATVSTVPVSEKSLDSRTVSSATSSGIPYNTDKPKGTVIILF